MEFLIRHNDITPNQVSAIFQKGVLCPAQTPTSVQEFLTQQLQFPADYVRDRIATLFLDGMVVDDPNTSIVEDGSTLGLSAAMPGLVGATLRKSGYYAPMRSQINWTTDHAGDTPEKAPAGTVRVKLYNLILREQARAVLARGIMISREDLIELLPTGVPDAPEPAPREMILLRLVDGPAGPRSKEPTCA